MRLRKTNLYLILILLLSLRYNYAHGQTMVIQEELKKLPTIKDSTILVNSPISWECFTI